MKSLPRLVTIAIFAFLAACNFPGEPPNPVQDQAATIVAQTMAALAPSSGVTPFASPVPKPSTTPSKPTLVIIGTAACRRGPSNNFALITSFTSGTKLDVVGKNPESNFWQVAIPSSSDTCWVAADHATVTGDTSALPEATAQASKPNVPASPSSLFYNFSCTFPSGVTVDLSWTDKANNESGYRVYRNGTQIADLPQNSTSYSDTTTISSGTVYTYAVEAYNDVGASPQVVTRRGDPITCQ